MKAAQKLYKHCTGEELKSGVVYRKFGFKTPSFSVAQDGFTQS